MAKMCGVCETVSLFLETWVLRRGTRRDVKSNPGSGRGSLLTRIRYLGQCIHSSVIWGSAFIHPQCFRAPTVDLMLGQCGRQREINGDLGEAERRCSGLVPALCGLRSNGTVTKHKKCLLRSADESNCP